MANAPPHQQFVTIRHRRARRSLSALIVALACAAPSHAVDFIQGVDVSRFQGDIDWSSVKNAGVEFAFAKATEGVDFVDIKYHANMQNARNAGVMIGPYHFCRIDTKNGVPFSGYTGQPFLPGTPWYEDAVSEADDFLEAIVPKYLTGQHLPPVADVERRPAFGNIELEKTFVSNWMQLFSDTVHNALGVRPIVYTGLFYANNLFTPSVAAGHKLWLAWWKGTGTDFPPQVADTPLWEPWSFWQWTDSWSVPGIGGNVDGDVFSGTIDELTELLLGFDGALAGDYNRDGTVDAADYVVWRKSSGQVVPLFTGADGNGDSRVNSSDYAIWRANFGRSVGGAGGQFAANDLPATRFAGVPEPSSAALMLPAIALWCVPASRTATRRASR